MNEAFEKVFALPDGSGIEFAQAEPARNRSDGPEARFELHLEFAPQTKPGNSIHPDSAPQRQQIADERETARAKSQTDEIVALIRSHLDQMEAARGDGKKYRVAVLGRARTALAPIASALREAGTPISCRRT